LFFGYFLKIFTLIFLKFSDVVSIPKTNENFRLLYDTKGRFRLHSIRDEEAKVGCPNYLITLSLSLSLSLSMGVGYRSIFLDIMLPYLQLQES
jgi:hypothetical protein